MRDTHLFLALFIALAFFLSAWQRKALRTLPDEERLKVMDYMMKAGLWTFLPAAVILGGFLGFHMLKPGYSFPAYAVFLLLLALSIWGRSYITYRKLNELGVSAAYLRTRLFISLIRGTFLAAFFGYLLWTVYQAGHRAA